MSGEEKDRQHPLGQEITLQALLTNMESPASGRRIYALVGPPGSGKTTLANHLCLMLKQKGCDDVAVIGMDGFHLDNRILQSRGLVDRKGSIETIDAHGVLSCVKRLSAADQDVVIPVFDREMDCAIAGADIIPSSVSIVILEGNYLLANKPVWEQLKSMFYKSVMLHTSLVCLRDRLLFRWMSHNKTHSEASKKVDGNDLPNAEFIMTNSLRADYALDTESYHLSDD